MTLTTVNDPATAALHWYQQLDADGRARYDKLVIAVGVGVDVDELTGWAQLALAWLAGEDHARLSEALVELFTASRRTDVLDGLTAAGMPQLAEAEHGCDGCREVGPLLTAPGTSGRNWICQTCGTVWPGAPLADALPSGGGAA